MRSDTGLLNPFVPTITRPWDKKLVTHLLSRTMFGAKIQDINYVLSLTPQEAVDMLLQDYELPPPPGSWVTETPDYNSNYNTQRMNILRNWWLKLMYEQPVSFREKMTLFWHNHFTSEDDVVRIPQHMYLQNILFRANAFGNFKTLALKVTTDPAMLYYLDGRLNTAGAPNENYSRELLELFTIGIGNYTETDIREGARALTGWTINGLNPLFVPSRHDNNNKTYLGQTGNWNETDVINIIFSKPQTAVTFCRKLYKNFVNQKEDMSYATGVIDDMANLLRSNNYELKPLFKILFRSQLFYSENVISSVIKSPIDMMVSLIRQLNIQLDPSSLNTQLAYIYSQASSAGQFILSPPNVQGWPGYRQWLNTLTMPVRTAFAESVITGRQKTGGLSVISVNPITFAMQFPEPNDAVKLVNDICTHMVRLELTPKQKENLLLTLLDGSAVYDWDINSPEAPARVIKFLKALIYLAEYQLN
jgi:hypothetical protein